MLWKKDPKISEIKLEICMTVAELRDVVLGLKDIVNITVASVITGNPISLKKNQNITELLVQR